MYRDNFSLTTIFADKKRITGEKNCERHQNLKIAPSCNDCTATIVTEQFPEFGGRLGISATLPGCQEQRSPAGFADPEESWEKQ